MEWGKGLVQRQEKEKQREELEKNRSLPFSRYKDDKELNEMQKEKEIWNDPMAAFLSVRGLAGYMRAYTDLVRLFTEKAGERASEARVYRSTTSAKSVRHQARVSLGWRRCVNYSLYLCR